MTRPPPAFQRRIISTASGNTTTSSGPFTNRPSASSLPWRTVPSRSRYRTGTARPGPSGGTGPLPLLSLQSLPVGDRHGLPAEGPAPDDDNGRAVVRQELPAPPAGIS